MGDEPWEKLLGWHDDIIRRLITNGGGRVVNPTGDGFFAAFEEPEAAVSSAVAIQRALAGRRETEGSAPPVRIGLHTTEATQRGNDYSGVGVHVAARIAALANGGEILASTDSLDRVDGYGVSQPREVDLRGVSARLSVSTVDWTG
jgi:class 3 adenylate cyclase